MRVNLFTFPGTQVLFSPFSVDFPVFVWYPLGRAFHPFSFEFPHLTLGWSLDRSELCGPKPSPLAYVKNEHICGRPLGLRFDKKTGDLYIADAYFGLMKVGPEGGLAVSLVNEVEGVPLMFTNDLDIDDDGTIYFTDSSSVYRRRYCFFILSC